MANKHYPIKQKTAGFVLLMLMALMSSAQSNKTIDSLRRITLKTKVDTTRISAYISWHGELFEHNRLDSALTVLNTALASCNSALNGQTETKQRSVLLRQKANILIYQAQLYRKLGNPSKSIEILKQSQRLSDSIGYKLGYAQSVYQIGDAYDFMGNLEKALEYFYISLELFRDLDEVLGTAKALKSIGVAYDYMGELDRALDYSFQALEVYQSINEEKGIADQYNNIGIINYLKGDYLTALDYYYQSAKINEAILSQRYVYATTIYNIGLIYDNLGDMLNAHEYYNRSVRIFESLEFHSNIVLPLNNIGDAYLNQGEYAKAIEYYLRSLKISEEFRDAQNRAYTLDKICSFHINRENFEEGGFYCEKCLEAYQEMGDKHGIALALGSTGKLNQKMGNFGLAYEYYQKSLRVFEEIGDRQGISKALFQLGNVELMQEDYSDAYKYAIKAHKIAKELNFANEILSSANLLHKLYRKQGNFAKALEYYEEYANARHSLESDELKKVVQEQYYKRQYETKAAADSISYAQQMAIKNLELERKKGQAQRQQWLIYTVVFGLIIFLTFSIILLRLFTLKRFAYQQLEQSNWEINQQNEEIIAQRDEIELQRNMLQEKNALLEQANAEVSAQRDMVISQKEKLEEVNEHITDSLRYAQSIQAAILPSEKILQQISPDHFVLMKPCELVSGDFFWVTTFEEYRIFCVADCTGHGVPGAFMSILGITALNDIVVKHRISKPSEILRLLRESVIEALSQNDPDQLHKDGMDISLCVFNPKTRELQFAGAGLPLWLVVAESQEEVELKELGKPIVHSRFQLHEIKGDNMPVGHAPKVKPFTNNSIILSKQPISIYLATDGFVDQMGGENGAKFGGTNFKRLILENAAKPFNQQRKALDEKFIGWKGSKYQVDDFTILGIKI